MTVVPAAGSQPALRQTVQPPIHTSEAVSGGFRELLEERRALTDPEAGPDGRAPLAVPFDQGALFGTAVSLRHDRASLASAPEAEAGGRRSEPAAPPAEPMSISAEPVDVGIDSQEVVQPAADRAALGPMASVSSPTAGGETASDRRTDTPPPPGAVADGGAPAPPAGKPRGVAEAPPAHGMQARAEAGSARRRQAVAQLAPVNVVARATAVGVEIAVRIGHRLGDDDEALEGAVRRAVEAEGEALDGLRVDGREIEGSRRCR